LGVVTRIRPVVAPDGTVAVIRVELVTTNPGAFTLLKVTEVVPVKFVPLIVTDVPTGPDVGENELIVGAVPDVTVKLLALVAVPTPVVAWIGPLVAPAGTVAVTWVEEPGVKDAEVPLKSTPTVPRRLVPLIVTEVPTAPLVGVKEEMLGAHPPGLATVNVELVAVPLALVTWIGPVVAPEGTVARISVGVTRLMAAGVPLKSTPLTSGFVKFAPVIVTTHPAGPLVGVNDEIVGATARAGPASATRSRAIARVTPAVRSPVCRCVRAMDHPFCLGATTTVEERERGVAHPEGVRHPQRSRSGLRR
jgi:hypothetical protein